MEKSELKKRRENLRLTQAQMAEQLGVKENTVYRWEAGLSPISKMVELSLESLERNEQSSENKNEK